MRFGRLKAWPIVAEGIALGWFVTLFFRPVRAHQAKGVGLPLQGEIPFILDTEGVALGYDGCSLSGCKLSRAKENSASE